MSARSLDLVLRVENLVKDFPAHRNGFGPRQTVRAVDHVSLRVSRGETLGIVGESGCGKSTLARCLARLIDVTSGTIELDGRDITRLSRRKLRPVRRHVQMVFQDPYASLNPRRRAGEIVAEPLLIQSYGNRGAVVSRVNELLELVGLGASAAERYPHEFSGGQRQRIGIARALAMSPDLIIADEPVSALDVSIQAQVLNLLADMQEQLGLTYIFIAHDLGVAHHVSDRVAVMYLGAVVELSPADDLYAAPAHPYTEALLSASPEIDDGTAQTPQRERIVLAGDPPSAIDRPGGCAFHPRCRYAQQICAAERPALVELDAHRSVACHFPLVVPTESDDSAPAR